jgi:RNA polymerase subunit RPABC4/transcription elongation factor Spt4
MPTTAPQIACQACHQFTSDGKAFCRNCGARLNLAPLQSASEQPPRSPIRDQSGGLQCPYCQSPVRPRQQFCPTCGRPITPAAGPLVPARYVPPIGFAIGILIGSTVVLPEVFRYFRQESTHDVPPTSRNGQPSTFGVPGERETDPGKERGDDSPTPPSDSSPRPLSGAIVWSGATLRDGELIVIYGSTATRGRISRPLPGFPVIVVVEGAQLLRTPTRQDGWKRIVLRGNRPTVSRIVVRWEQASGARR